MFSKSIIVMSSVLYCQRSLVRCRDDMAQEVDKFVAVLELNKDTVSLWALLFTTFGDASYTLSKNREEKLRLPTNQPLSADIIKVKTHTTEEMEKLTAEMDFCDEHKFIQLRDNLVARLTLFNARHGGEPSRLFMKNSGRKEFLN